MNGHSTTTRSVGFIYNHYAFDSRNVTLTDPNLATPSDIIVKTQIDTAKVTFNYRFWAGTR